MKQNISKNKLIIGGIIIAVVFIFIGVLLFWGNGKNDIDKTLDLGNRFLNEHNYEEAIAAFEEAIGIDDKLIEAYAGLIEAYHGLGDDEMAMEYTYVLGKVLKEMNPSERRKYVSDVDSVEKIIQDMENQNPNINKDAVLDDLSNILGDTNTDNKDNSDDDTIDADSEKMEADGGEGPEANDNLVLNEVEISTSDLDELLAAMKAEDYMKALSLLESGKYDDASKRNGGIYYTEGASGALSGIKDGSGIRLIVATKETVLANSPDADPSWDIPNQYRVVYTTWNNGKKTGRIDGIEYVDTPGGLYKILQSSVEDSQMIGSFHYEFWQEIPEWGTGWTQMYISEGNIVDGCYASGAAKLNVLYWPFGFMDVVLEDGLLVGGEGYMEEEHTFQGNSDILISPVGPSSGSIKVFLNESANVYE